MPSVDFSVPRWLEPPSEAERARIDEARSAASQKAGAMITRAIGMRRMQADAQEAIQNGVDPVTARQNALINNAGLLFSDRPAEAVESITKSQQAGHIKQTALLQAAHAKEQANLFQSLKLDQAQQLLDLKAQQAEDLNKRSADTLDLKRQQAEDLNKRSSENLDLKRQLMEQKGAEKDFEPTIVGAVNPLTGKAIPVLRTGPKTSQMIEAKATKPTLGEVDKAELKSIYKRIDGLQTAHDALTPEQGDVTEHPNTVKRMHLNIEITKLRDRAKALEAKKAATGVETDAPAAPAAAPSAKAPAIKLTEGKKYRDAAGAVKTYKGADADGNPIWED